MQKHHLLPQAPTLSAWFKERGINIHDHTILIPTHVHRRIHGGGPSEACGTKRGGSSSRHEATRCGGPCDA
ncbi:DUF2380 domain-containing protein [Myxococcus sp. AM009]|nr:DUF2380 domain-containing protein [Myxococcus sp. AM009]